MLSIIFSLQVCLVAKHGKWFLDGGCLRHTTRDKEKFSNLDVDGGNGGLKDVGIEDLGKNRVEMIENRIWMG